MTKQIKELRAEVKNNNSFSANFHTLIYFHPPLLQQFQSIQFPYALSLLYIQLPFSSQVLL